MPFFMRTMLKVLRVPNTTILIVVFAFVFGSATIAYALEPSTFHNWFNALYWVMTTMATVGYGDFFAKTYIGKAFTIFIYVFGIGLLSLIIGKVIDMFSTIYKHWEAGKLNFHGKDHIIIINWSKKAQYAIEEILSFSPSSHIVIIDESDKHPILDRHEIHFISGDPSSEEILEKAMIREAKAVIIFADTRIDEPALTDGKTLLIASSIERLHPNVHTTVEITQDKNTKNFRHVKVNDFVLSYDAVSRLAVRAALQQGSSEIINQLISREVGDDIYEIPAKREWRTYKDAFLGTLEYGATLLSDRGDLGINRKLNEPIPQDARLFVVSDEATYLKLKSSK
ncbi:potassium channel family protein [Paenibacillus lupini]|uniref:potassium channel protein n=1 Tax=Paenibacillus lupini TaxID=1450204 RepID=UPI0014230C1D|nr:potassium channel family protein [Paenibacillus lupini]NIK21737.1 voltage-gated potassium channel [Paenibacillus lupini]